MTLHVQIVLMHPRYVAEPDVHILKHLSITCLEQTRDRDALGEAEANNQGKKSVPPLEIGMCKADRTNRTGRADRDGQDRQGRQIE